MPAPTFPEQAQFSCKASHHGVMALSAAVGPRRRPAIPTRYCDINRITVDSGKNKKEFIIWNNAQYKQHDYTFADELETSRWVCVKNQCNAAIYVRDNELVGTRRHDALLQQLHIPLKHDEPHAFFEFENAVASINRAIAMGQGRRQAFDEYRLSHGHQASALRSLTFRNVSHRLSSTTSRLPAAPPTVHDVEQCMEEQRPHGWTQNHYGRSCVEYEEKLQALEAGPFKDHLLHSMSYETEALLASKQIQAAKLMKEVDLLRLKLTKANCVGLKSEFWAGASKKGHIFGFAERESFEICNQIRLLLADTSWKFVFSTGLGLDCDAMLLVHAVADSPDIRKMHEKFTLSYAQFKSGKGNHTQDDYEEAFDLFIQMGKEHGIDISQKPHDTMADFAIHERKAHGSKMNVSGNRHGGCGYHFTHAFDGALSQYGLKDLYLHDRRFRRFCRITRAIRAVPPKLVRKAFEASYRRIADFTPADRVEQVEKMWREWLLEHWLDGRYDVRDWNEYMKRIRTNNFAEATHEDLLHHKLGYHPTVFQGIEDLARYSASEMVRWRHFKKHGFCRPRSPQSQRKEAALEMCWDAIAHKKAHNPRMGVWEYMEAVSMVYDLAWDEFVPFMKQFGMQFA